jgi:hypothetical protein
MITSLQRNYLLKVLFLIVAGLIGYRLYNVDGLLIYRHSYGESQYALWAKAYIDEGLFWGIKEVDRYIPIVDYFPVASMLSALVYDMTGGDLIVIGRLVSVFFSIIACCYYYKYCLLLFNDKIMSAISLIIFVSLPINMYFSKTFYNDPLHLCFIIMFFYYLHSCFTDSSIKWVGIKLTTSFFLILITKVSTAVMCIPVIGYFFFREMKQTGRIDNRKIIQLTLPLALVGAILAYSRYLHSDAYFVESNKMVNMDVVNNFKEYAVKATRQVVEEFGYYIPLYIVGFIAALRPHAQFRYFAIMSAGFLAFYVIIIRGALVHQYYSLPFALPFSIISTFGLLTILGLAGDKHKGILYGCFIILSVSVFLNTKGHFKSIYSNGIIETTEFIRDNDYSAKTMVLGGSCRVMQYYLNLGTKSIKCDMEAFLKATNLSDYMGKNNFEYIVTEGDRTWLFANIVPLGFQPIYASPTMKQGARYVVFKKN